jgi:excisionase family DNA binding protein
MPAVLDREPIAAAPAETPTLQQLADLIRQDGLSSAELVGPGGQRIRLPESVRQLLVSLIRELVRGRAVSILTHGKDLTTNEAADLLNVSRPYLIKLIDSKMLPCHRVGKHRRIPAEAVLAYRARQRVEQAAILAALTQEAQDTGFYD